MDIQTVAVFGGSGKIGRRLIAQLVDSGRRVGALVHRTPIEGEGVITVPGSVTDPDAVDAVVAGADAVVQMATAKEDPETFFDVSIRGTFHILESCRRHGVRQFVLLSGDAVFGIWFHPHPVPIDENHPMAAYPGYYAFSKVIEEEMTRQYASQYGLPYTILRSSWVFQQDDLLQHFSLLKNVDPAEPGHGFGKVPAHIERLVHEGREHVPILTDGNGVPFHRHIVHLEDVAHAFERMLGNPAAVGESFNIAAPAPFEYRAAAEYLAQKLDLPTVEIPCPEYHSFAINISKARTMLGYDPQYDFFAIADDALAYVAGD